MEGNQEFLFSFPKNEQEEIRFSIRVFKRRVYFDIRTYFKSDSGEWFATKKGITLSLGLYDKFRKGIEIIGEKVSVLEHAA